MSYIYIYTYLPRNLCFFFRSYLITQYSHRFKSSYSILPRVSWWDSHPWSAIHEISSTCLECPEARSLGHNIDDLNVDASLMIIQICGDLWGEWWSDPLSCRIKFNSRSTCWLAIMYFWFWDELSTWSGFHLILLDFASKGWDSEQFQLFCAWAQKNCQTWSLRTRQERLFMPKLPPKMKQHLLLKTPKVRAHIDAQLQWINNSWFICLMNQTWISRIPHAFVFDDDVFMD